MLENTLLLFPLPGRDYPFGYLLAALFLIAAIVLFIISIFMKNGDQRYDEENYEPDPQQYPENYNNWDAYDRTNGIFDESEYYEPNEYEEQYTRYDSSTQPVDTTPFSKETEELKNLVADVSEELETTRAFHPIQDSGEEAEGYSRYHSPAGTVQNQDTQYYTTAEQWQKNPELARNGFEEFAEEIDTSDQVEVEETESLESPLHAAGADKPGMSFADEVKRLIEEIEEEENRQKQK